MWWRVQLYGWPVLWLLLGAACKSDDSAAPGAADSGIPFGPTMLHRLNILPQPAGNCVEDASSRADYPNQAQIVNDEQPLRVIRTEAGATLASDAAGAQTLWIKLSAISEERADQSATFALDASALSEGEAQTFQLDMVVTGSYEALESEPVRLTFTPQAGSSPPLRSLLVRGYCSCAWSLDYRVTGTLALTRQAGRLRGTVSFTVDNKQQSKVLPGRQIRWSACFDAPIASRGDSAELRRQCTLEQAVEPSDTPDCGKQGRSVGMRLDTRRIPSVTECVREKLQSEAPFHVQVEYQGVDSRSISLWERDSSGLTWRYDYDSYDPYIVRFRCEHPYFVQDPQPNFADELIACNAYYGSLVVCENDRILDRF